MQNEARKLVIPEPNEKQRIFLKAKNKYIAYGGARGGGKSWSVRVKATLLSLKYPKIKIAILRRTYQDLKDNHILPLQEMLNGIAYYKNDDKVFVFKNGSRINFGYCDSERDLLQYQGPEYDILFIDEATQFPEEWYTKITACIRGVNNFPKRIYLTCNPGGVGHGWVKRLFIDRQFKGEERPEDYLMIRAYVQDNTALVDKDPEYIRMLQNLPTELRRAWLDGDWNVFAGQYFTEFRENIHVISQFTPPKHWKKYFTMDYGQDMLAGYWIAMDEHENAFVYREIYKSRLMISQAAELIKQNTLEPVDYYFAPPDMWNRHPDTGKSTAEIFAEHGIFLIRTSNDRIQGWYNMHEWLRPYSDEQGKQTAHLRICDTCVNLIRTLPALQYDEKKPNDCANEPHEITHAPDAIRYFISGRPLPTVILQEPDEDNVEYDDQVESFMNWGR